MHLHPTAILEKNGLPLKGFLRHLSSCNSRLCDAMALVQTTSIYRKSLRFPTVPLWSHSKISPPVNWLGSLPGIRLPRRTHSDAPKWMEYHPTIPSENGHCPGIDTRKCGSRRGRVSLRSEASTSFSMSMNPALAGRVSVR